MGLSVWLKSTGLRSSAQNYKFGIAATANRKPGGGLFEKGVPTFGSSEHQTTEGERRDGCDESRASGFAGVPHDPDRSELVLCAAECEVGSNI